MNRLPNKRSSAHDGINNIILKEIGEYICTPLTYLFNESMTMDVFPDAMKIAEVVPLYKAIGEFISKVVKNIQLGKTTAGIFLDLSKAFDMLEHSVVYKKLERYGIRGKALDWFKSYLSDRKLQTKCRTASSSTETRSKLFDVTVGIPQGSCLGPLIFLIFCNNLRLHLTHLQCIQFADDTTLFTSHKSERYLKYCCYNGSRKTT